MKRLNHFFFLNFLIIAMSFNLTSCSDLSSEPEDLPVVTEELTCGADIGEFSNIFSKLITKDIECLHTDLKFFMKTVVSERQGFLPLKNLLEYLKENEEDYDEDMENIVTAFFDISYLVVGGKKGFVSPDDVDNIVEFLTFVNREASAVNLIVNEDRDEIGFHSHLKDRERIRDAVENLKEYVFSGKIFNNSGLRFLDLEKLINLFRTEDTDQIKGNSDGIDKVLSVLFVKKALVGGDKNNLTSKQLFDPNEDGSCEDCLFGKIVELGTLSFDLFKIQKIIFDSHEQELSFYRNILNRLKVALYGAPAENAVITNIPELTKAIDLFSPGLISEGVLLAKFNDNIEELTDVLFGNKDSDISFGELHDVFDLGLDIFDMGVYFGEKYSENSAVLNGPERISVELVDCSETARNSVEGSHCKRFNRIALKYRYFGGSFKLPYFAKDYYRNVGGFFQIGLIESLLEKAFVYYDDDDQVPTCDPNEIVLEGKKPCYNDGVNRDKDRTQYTMYLRQIRKIIKGFFPLLSELGIVIPGRIFSQEYIASADNVVLMSSLFQNQSNGSDDKDRSYVEVKEITELLISILSAMDLKVFFSERMLDLCSGDLIEGKVAPDCFRDKFIEVINSRITGSTQSIADFMPKLANYINELNDKDLYRYVEESEKFTRVCMNYNLTQEEFTAAMQTSNPATIDYSNDKGEVMPLSKTDMFAVFAGLFSVESTINRFDVNHDGKMNPSEVDVAFYEVYQGVLRNLSKANTSISKKLFYYLIKNERPPETIWEKLAMMTAKNKRSATRKKMAAILTAIGEQSDSNNPKTACYNPYCCDMFRTVVDSVSGVSRELNPEEKDRVMKACIIKFKKVDHQYPSTCEEE